MEDMDGNVLSTNGAVMACPTSNDANESADRDALDCASVEACCA
jgi:hypothetical protein